MTHPHRIAQQLAEQADMLIRDGRQSEALELYAEAAEAEAEALTKVTKDKPRTYGILAVSVAALWYKARRFDAAERAACNALGLDVLDRQAIGQLRELLEAIWNEESISSAGVADLPEQIVIAASGGQVGHGLAPFGLAIQLQNNIGQLVIRVAEFIGGFPVRRRGQPSPDLRAAFQLQLTTATAGSYKFAFNLIGADQRRPFERPIDTTAVADTVMNFVAAAAEGDPAGLQAVMPDLEYRLTLLQLLRNASPNGQTFVELGVARRGGRAVPRLLTVDRGIRAKINHCMDTDQAGLSEIRGLLRGVNLDLNSLRIVQDNGAVVKCKIKMAPGLLDDVIGPWVNTRVVARGNGSSESFDVHDIQPEE